MKKMYFNLFIIKFLLLNLLVLEVNCQSPDAIPLPEHPRPDFQREQWLNLNGIWNFRFDQQNIGEKFGRYPVDPSLIFVMKK